RRGRDPAAPGAPPPRGGPVPQSTLRLLAQRNARVQRNPNVGPRPGGGAGDPDRAPRPALPDPPALGRCSLDSTAAAPHPRLLPDLLRGAAPDRPGRLRAAAVDPDAGDRLPGPPAALAVRLPLRR